MDFRVFIVEQFIDRNIFLVGAQLAVFVLLYLLILRNQIWSILDPLFMACVTMGGATFCVWKLYENNYVENYYIYSFLATEAVLIITLINSYRFFSGYTLMIGPKVVSSYKKVDLHFLCIFLFLSGISLCCLQLYSFATIGVVLLEEDVNHVSAYDGHGNIKALLTGLRSIFVVAFFYKMIFYRMNLIDYLFFLVYIAGILLSGSKSSLLIPIFYYLVLNYYFYKRGLVSKLKIKLWWILLLPLFPLIIIMVKSDAPLLRAIYMFGARVIASGDVFVLGYDKDVMNAISEKSFFKYLFYPGFGSILKNVGFSITPPETIGPDIYDYYYGDRTGGPNGRHNYLGLLFLGPYASLIFSATIGVIIGYVRGCFISQDRGFFNLVFFVMLYSVILNLIVDVNIFMNAFFWNTMVLVVIYCIANVLFNLYRRL